MDFERRRQTRQSMYIGLNIPDNEVYQHAMQFYKSPPTGHVSLQEFEDFAIDRLKVLKLVEQAGMKHVKGGKEWVEWLEKEIRLLRQGGAGLKAVTQTYHANRKFTPDEMRERRKDHVSHFILRLAYCRSEDLRRWFIQQEVDLFRFRFSRENTESRSTFMTINDLEFKPIPDSMKDSLRSKLQQSDPKASVDRNDFFRVPFTEVLDLVRSRKVYLECGNAFIPTEQLSVLINNVFRTHLSKALALTCRALPALAEDNRLEPLLRGITKRYLGDDYGSKRKQTAGQVTAAMIDQLCKESFPLCMSNLHSCLRSSHHLRHGGRQQYGLFLKGIGLSLEEAMTFWRLEFTKLIDADKFTKQYSYNIRHNYGQEGKRADYTPYSCIKIIQTNHPAAGDHHGCPFKHWDVQLLEQRLQALHIEKAGQEEILEKAKRGEYQVACGRYFYYTHRSLQPEQDFNPNHPNHYYEESRALRDDKREIQAKRKAIIASPKKTRDDDMDTDLPMDEIAALEASAV